MYKSFLILTFLVLFGSYSQHVPGQTTTDKRLSGINVKDPKNPTDSFATVVSATQASNAEAMELYREGTKLTEAGQFSQAVEKFQQALKLDPEFAEAYSGLGRAQFKMRQWQESAVNFRRAIALRTKQQALQDAPHQKDATRESNEVRPQVTSAPASTPNKQEPNANVATVKSQRPELTQRPRHASDISTPAQRMPTTAQTKLPSDSNRNDVGVKRPNPESQTTRQSAQHNEVTAPAEAITKSPQVTLPQGNGNNAAGVKLASNSQTTRPLQQRNEVSISSQPVPTSSHVTQQTNTANVDVKLRNPEPQMTRQPPPHDAVSAPHAIPKAHKSDYLKATTELLAWSYHFQNYKRRDNHNNGTRSAFRRNPFPQTHSSRSLKDSTARLLASTQQLQNRKRSQHHNSTKQVFRLRLSRIHM